jgi:hypothetical protein
MLVVEIVKIPVHYRCYRAKVVDPEFANSANHAWRMVMVDTFGQAKEAVQRDWT